MEFVFETKMQEILVIVKQRMIINIQKVSFVRNIVSFNSLSDSLTLKIVMILRILHYVDFHLDKIIKLMLWSNKTTI